MDVGHPFREEFVSTCIDFPVKKYTYIPKRTYLNTFECINDKNIISFSEMLDCNFMKHAYDLFLLYFILNDMSKIGWDETRKDETK